MEKRTETKKTTVYLPLALAERIRRSAQQDRRSYNSQLVWLLEQALKAREQEKKQ